MNATVRKVESVSIIDCSGNVDLYTSNRLLVALQAEIRPGGGSVLVNMTGVGYIDSSGIATLVQGLQLSRKTKTRFGLFGLRNNARSVLELVRLHTVFNLFDDEQDALKKIGLVVPFEGL